MILQSKILITVFSLLIAIAFCNCTEDDDYRSIAGTIDRKYVLPDSLDYDNRNPENRRDSLAAIVSIDSAKKIADSIRFVPNIPLDTGAGFVPNTPIENIEGYPNPPLGNGVVFVPNAPIEGLVGYPIDDGIVFVPNAPIENIVPHPNPPIENTQHYPYNLIENGVSDIDGNEYSTVQIGEQLWMAENLNVSRFRNGDIIDDGDGEGDITDQVNPLYAWTDPDAPESGRFYTYHAVADNRSVCPTNWHAPTVAEIFQLRDRLLADGFDNGRNDGDKNHLALAMASESGWKPSTVQFSPGGPDEHNSSRFSAMPSGNRIPWQTSVTNNGDYFLMWASDLDYKNEATYFAIFLNDVSLMYTPDRPTIHKRFGASVRCVKN